MHIQAGIDTIPIEETLRYLGWRGGSIDEHVRFQIEEAHRLILQQVHPLAVVKRLKLLDDGTFAGTGFLPEGNDVQRLLSGCEEAVLMAVTLGAQSERMLLRAQAVSAAQAVILDAALSASIEAVCDRVSMQIVAAARQEEMYVTRRFSPGYGDMPIAQIRSICDVLDTARKIGLTVSASGLMIPRKSVCAVSGIGKGKKENCTTSCETCCMKDRCGMQRSMACGHTAEEQHEGNYDS